MTARWLGHYTSPLPIRCRGAFHLYATRHADDASPRVVVVGARHADRARVEACFDAVVEAHARVDDPLVPRVAERGRAEGVIFLALHSDAEVDLEHLLEVLIDEGGRLPYALAVGLFERLAEVLVRAHAAAQGLAEGMVTTATSRLDGGATEAAPPLPSAASLVLGALSLNNFLVSPSGRHALLGLGANLVVTTETGAPAMGTGAYRAPEVAAGGRATPSGDGYMFVDFGRALLPYIDLPAGLARAMQHEPRPGDEAAVEHFLWHLRHVFGAPRDARASLGEILATHHRTWRALGVVPDLPGFERWCARLFARQAARLDDDSPSAPRSALLRVGEGAAWVEREGGERIELHSRRTLRRIAWALVQRALAEPGGVLSLGELLAAGWPGEAPLRDAASNRVHVSLSTLRGLGLRDLIERHGAGYRLRAETRVILIEVEPAA